MGIVVVATSRSIIFDGCLFDRMIDYHFDLIIFKTNK